MRLPYEILFDIVPREARYILLGSSCQYDHKTIHDGFTNKKKVSLIKEENNFVFSHTSTSEGVSIENEK